MSPSARTRGELEVQAERSPATRGLHLPLSEYIHAHAVAGAGLLAGAIMALVWVNSPVRETYDAVWGTPLHIAFGEAGLDLDLHAVVVDGLMALFFVLAALEINRELIEGDLSARQRATLPVAAAAGGIILPAAIYLAVGLPTGAPPQGWAVPIATDVAFALGVLALLGDRVPTELRVLLLAITVIDDLIGILIIALVYTGELAVMPLVVAVLLFGGVLLAVRIGLRNPIPFVMLGVALWVATLLSGIHPTIAGVALGLATPVRRRQRPNATVDRIRDLAQDLEESIDRGDPEETEAVLGRGDAVASATESPLDRIERLLRPWVNFIVLPAFALTAAGVAIEVDRVGNALTGGASGAIVLGLVVGKPIGIMAGAWLVRRIGIGSMPEGVGWRDLAGLGLLSGIGFTVSIFLTGGAFTDAQQMADAKLGVLLASAIAAPLGYGWLRWGRSATR